MNSGVNDQLLSGENLRWKTPALRSFGRVTVAGTLCVTQRRLLFVPDGVNIRRRPAWSVALGHVRRVDIANRTFQPFNGGMRRRLVVETTESDDQRFVVKDVESVKKALQGLIFENGESIPDA